MDPNEAHNASSGHEAALLRSKSAGCFYCLAIFPPSEITAWVNDPPTMGLRDGRTALCPRCGIDAVLPDAIMPITPDFLDQMKKEWF